VVGNKDLCDYGWTGPNGRQPPLAGRCFAYTRPSERETMQLQTTRRAADHQVAIEPSRLRNIRDRLEQERCFRIDQVAKLAGELAEEGLDHARLQVTREIRSAALYMLTEIESAIARLEDGSYGTCLLCGETVEWKRLEAVPSTKQCLPCDSSA